MFTKYTFVSQSSDFKRIIMLIMYPLIPHIVRIYFICTIFYYNSSCVSIEMFVFIYIIHFFIRFIIRFIWMNYWRNYIFFYNIIAIIIVITLFILFNFSHALFTKYTDEVSVDFCQIIMLIICTICYYNSV